MQSRIDLENQLQIDAREHYELLVKSTDLIVHDLIAYGNDAFKNFCRNFKNDPLNRLLVNQYIESYVPEKSRVFPFKPLNNQDLSPLIEHQNKLIALDKIGNKKEPLTSLSKKELSLILTCPQLEDKYSDIISPLISQSKKNSLSTNNSAYICKKIGFFTFGVASAALAYGIANSYNGYNK